MGTKSRPQNALAAIFVAKTRKPGRYADGNELYLIIEPSGSRRWEQRILIRGKRRTLGLGGYSLVSLAVARERPWYRDSKVNGAFASNLDDLIERYRPRLWIHGHMHDPVDERIGATRIIANPHGFSLTEGADFEPSLIVTV